MEIIARIVYNEESGQLVYYAEIVANHVPLNDPHVNIMAQAEALEKAHKTIELAIGKLNGQLSQQSESERQP